MKQIADRLRSEDFIVVSRWLESTQDAMASGMDDGQRAAIAEADLRDVERCDVFVAFVEVEPAPGYARGGRHVELGAAFAFGRHIVLVGDATENIFHVGLPRVKDADDLVKFMREFRELTQ
jgi:nucleoside 2-deoxyribosyltransferase